MHPNDDFSKGYCTHWNQTECQCYPDVELSSSDPETDYAFPGARDEDHYDEIISYENHLSNFMKYAGQWACYNNIYDGINGYKNLGNGNSYKLVEYFSVKSMFFEFLKQDNSEHLDQ